MDERNECLNPLSVLIVFAEPGLDAAPFLSALRSNFILVCPTPAQALEAAECFEPDVVLIDVRVPSPANLMQELKQVVRGSNQLYVALSSATIPVVVPHLSGFDFALTLPASTSEFEHLLGQVRRHIGFGSMQALHVAS
jgi:CheY-like chemotaxis protein